MLLEYNNQPVKAAIQLTGSKSISNRLLILNEVLNLHLKLQNLSMAKDTQDLILALEQIKANKNQTIDIGHAGTDMRFLTALLSIKEGEWILTGSERMKERPIAELVNALRQIGGSISYLENEGFPPLKITGKKLSGGKIEIDGSISSQFISALLLISPIFENGLELKVKNEIVSRPYILMTLDLLSEMGIKAETILKTIIVKPFDPNFELQTPNSELSIESDWSSASYWYSIAALSKNAQITLKGLSRKSLQGDAVLHQIFESLGVCSIFENGNVVLEKTGNLVSHLEYDFTDCPDLAQTVAVTCLGLKVNCSLIGLSTLKHKETDRLLALKTEIEKFGAEVKITNCSLELRHTNQETSNTKHETQNLKPGTHLQLETYNDHRMAMSFAPLALIYDNIDIQNPEVVQKSYPEFWEHLKLIGIDAKF
jgi:3-phosphoshikimate 1-carboxyvinyltransferase